MATPTTAATDHYLRIVRQGLASLPVTEREDILAELRSHLSERWEQGSGDPLVGFDPPEKLAAEFVTEYALRGALAQGTSWALGRALLIAGRDGALGLLVLLPLLILQLSAAGLLLAAVLKPFLPDHVGLWVGGGRFYAGIVGQADGVTHEALGWWSIPVFAVVGGLLFWLPNRAMLALVRWRLRSTRSSHH